MKAQVTETVTIAQAKTALEQTARLYFQKRPDGSYAIDRRRARPVCLMGPAGIGKTEVVRQVAEEPDYPVAFFFPRGEADWGCGFGCACPDWITKVYITPEGALQIDEENKGGAFQ